jgi:hypothetical protein
MQRLLGLVLRGAARRIARVRRLSRQPGLPARDTVYEAVGDQAYAACMSKERSAARCGPDRSTGRCASQPGAAEHLRCPRGHFLRDERCFPIR